MHLLTFQELLAQEKVQASSSNNDEVDLDELMDVGLMIGILPYCILMFVIFTNVCLHGSGS